MSPWGMYDREDATFPLYSLEKNGVTGIFMAKGKDM